MTDVEDPREMASHFLLDSMLEVEMKVEDKEVDIPRPENHSSDNFRFFPNTPTFDLQSETQTYANVCRNTIIPPIIPVPRLIVPAVPQVLPIVSPGHPPFVSGKAPVVYIRTPSKPSITPSILKQSLTTVMKQPSNNNPRQQVSPIIFKTIQKEEPSLIIGKLPKVTKQEHCDDKLISEKFVQQIFMSQCVKTVYDKQDKPKQDVSVFGKEEKEYYKLSFSDISKVRFCKLHCTVCDKHLGCSILAEKIIQVHKVLKVLVCKSCSDFYGDGNFPCDKGDNCEIYCRWCSQGGALLCCSFCPRVFCRNCVRRNFGIKFLKSVVKAADWACFCCAQKPLWPFRAICRALVEFIQKGKASQEDTSICCDKSVLRKRKVEAVVNKNDSSVSGKSRNTSSITVGLKKNPIILPKIGGNQSILKTNVLQQNDNNQCLLNVNTLKPLSKTIKPSFVNLGKRIIPVQSVFPKIINASTNKCSSSSALGSSSISSTCWVPPETVLASPTSRIHLTPNAGPPSDGSSLITVSVNHQISNIDVNKIPTVKIPQSAHGLILRMTLPDNKVQFLRVIAGDPSKGIDQPTNGNDSRNLTPVERNLEDALSLSKIIHDKLLKIKRKVSTKAEFSEETAFTSSVNKLHIIYQKHVELLQELDKNLLELHEKSLINQKTILNMNGSLREKLKKSSRNSNGENVSFLEKTKRILPGDDSDSEKSENVTEKRVKKSIQIVGNQKECAKDDKVEQKIGPTVIGIAVNSNNLTKINYPVKRKRYGDRRAKIRKTSHEKQLDKRSEDSKALAAKNAEVIDESVEAVVNNKVTEKPGTGNNLNTVIGNDRKSTDSEDNLLRFAHVQNGMYRCVECEKAEIHRTFKNKHTFERHASFYHNVQDRKVV